MPRLSQDEIHTRLRLDYKAVMRMQRPTMQVTAYRSVDDVKARRRPITAEADGHLATHYLAEYRMRTLSGPDRYFDRTLVHFDLLANGNYPFSEPSCWVLSSPMPWSPHFKEGFPICLGEIWREANAKILLGHLLIHIAKLLNFDEVARGGGYQGWNPEAIQYWRERLHERPVTPGFVYPVLPFDVVHGLLPEGSVFRPSASKARPLDSTLFVPTSRPGY
jgi:hypothetical protein